VLESQSSRIRRSGQAIRFAQAVRFCATASIGLSPPHLSRIARGMSGLPGKLQNKWACIRASPNVVRRIHSLHEFISAVEAIEEGLCASGLLQSITQ
jgi:hypothetical protein